MFLVVRIPRKTVGSVSYKIGGHKRTTGEAGIATTVVSLCLGYFGNQIGIMCLGNSRLDKSFGFFVLKRSVSFRNHLVNWVVYYTIHRTIIMTMIRFVWVIDTIIDIVATLHDSSDKKCAVRNLILPLKKTQCRY